MPARGESSRPSVLASGLGGAGLAAGILLAAVGAVLVVGAALPNASEARADLSSDLVELATAFSSWAAASPSESWGLVLLGVGLVGAGLFVRHRPTGPPR